MQFNSFLFPAPENCYLYRRIENIVYIPNFANSKNAPKPLDLSKPKPNTGEETKTDPETIKKNAEIEKKKTSTYIPCLYLPYAEGSDKILIFFHGNAEDIGWAYDFCCALRRHLKIHVLAVEYPGYSLYIGTPNADKICQDAEVVFDFIHTQFKIPQDKIILFGRSIGSGAATHLAARRNPSALVLMSPYTSIGAVVKNFAGSLGQFMVAERFKNIEEITKIKCPVLFIHGMKDTLIPKEHSIELLNACSQTISHVAFSETMTHNDFELEDDVVHPLKKFLGNCGIKITNDKTFYEFPEEMHKKPECWKNKTNKRSFVTVLYEKVFES